MSVPDLLVPALAAGAISCEVYVDGTRIADDGPSWQVSTPTALEGLQITWGRDGPQSQPDVASCSLTVADKGGDTDFLGLLHVGHPLEVKATGEITTTDPQNVVVDGGMVTDPAARVSISGAGTTAVTDTTQDAVGLPGASIKITTPAGVSGWVNVPPAPFSTHPGGWIEIPQIGPGQTWTLTLKIRTGPIPNPNMRWYFAGFETEIKGLGQVWQIGTLQPIPSNPETWQSIGGTLTTPDPQTPLWLGIAVTNLWSPAWNQVPAALTWDQAAPGPWIDIPSVWIDEMYCYPPTTTTRTADVFVGRITDMTASALGDGVQVAITASEWTADLANQNVGDVPWLAERLDARAARIAALAAVRPTLYIDLRLRPYVLSWRDVDSQPALGLLQDLAVTGDGVLWPIGENVLWFEDPDTRSSAGVLSQDPGTGLITITGSRTGGAVVLSACDVIRDPLQLVQTVEDVITRADVTWLEQTVDDAGAPAPTERTASVTDDTARATFGERKFAVTTQLTTSTDASALANRVMIRSRQGAWHTNGMTWDMQAPPVFDATHELAAMELLDMSRRVGLLLTVTDCPPWVPTGPDLSAFVEGGQYSYTGGLWTLALTLAPSTYSGASLVWRDVNPAYQWVQFDPEIQWWDLWGVGPGTSTAQEVVSSA